MSWDFDLSKVETASEFELPNGTYTVQVQKAEIKETRAKNGKYLDVMFKVVSNKFLNKVIFYKFNIHNQNEVAQRIGRSELKALILALGFSEKDDSSPAALIGRMCDVTTKLKESVTYGKEITIVKFSKSTLNAVPVITVSSSKDEIPF